MQADRVKRIYYPTSWPSLAALVLTVAIALNPAPAHPSPAPDNAPGGADICRAAAQVVAAESGVPVNVLLAISLTETGRRRDGRLEPWPWTVNMQGEGRWFDTRAAAFAYANAGFQRGARSFDIGCFQINYRWHGQAFASISEMFDPLINARYAAQLLASLYAEKGTWPAAAGAYHSRTPKYADRYSRRFSGILSGMDQVEPVNAAAIAALGAATPRLNAYPLLQKIADGVRSPGSVAFLSAKGAASPLLTTGNGPMF
ncbi:MAG: transglycosylase SLT domain-containing protein [Rhodobacteraceae bacterium]|nr:transglycosylase SLT domain-containing protein [Paracoccaceae bacterium]